MWVLKNHDIRMIQIWIPPSFLYFTLIIMKTLEGKVMLFLQSLMAPPLWLSLTISKSWTKCPLLMHLHQVQSSMAVVVGRINISQVRPAAKSHHAHSAPFLWCVAGSVTSSGEIPKPGWKAIQNQSIKNLCLCSERLFKMRRQVRE
jgi:hypothetical protein